MGILERKARDKGTQDLLNNSHGEFPKINVKHQTTDPGDSENTRQDKYFLKEQKTIHRHVILKLQKIKDKKKILKKARGKIRLHPTS